MKYNYFYLTFLISVLIHSCTHEPVKWVEYKSDIFGFKIEFPRTPFENAQTADTERGSIKLNIIGLDCQKDKYSNNFVYFVNCSEFPESFFKDFTKESYDDFFKNSINGMVSGSTQKDASLQESKVIDFHGYEGREAKIIYPKGMAITTARFILKENKLYTLMITTDLKKESNPDIQKFFESFKLLSISNLELPKQASDSIDEFVKQKDEWILFADTVENFSILFPSPPVHQDKEINSEFGFLKGKGYFVNEPNTDFNLVYSVIAVKYEGVDKFKEKQLNDFFNIRRDGAVENFNGEVILEEKIFLRKNEGRRYRILNKNNNLILTQWCYLVGEKLYVVGVITPRKYDQNKNVYKFIDSFSLTETKRAKLM